MKALIIWQNIPESTHLYLVDFEEWMLECHKEYNNFCDCNEEALDKMSKFLESQKEIDGPDLEIVEISYVIATGSMM